MAFFITACMLVLVDIAAIFLIIENRALRKENRELRSCLPVSPNRSKEFMVMRHIRTLVYRMGFRPKPGNIFHSPSMHLMLIAKEAIKNWDTSKWTIITDDTTMEIERRGTPQ